MSKVGHQLLIYKMFCLETFKEVRVQNLNQIILWEEYCKERRFREDNGSVCY